MDKAMMPLLPTSSMGLQLIAVGSEVVELQAATQSESASLDGNALCRNSLDLKVRALMLIAARLFALGRAS